MFSVIIVLGYFSFVIPRTEESNHCLSIQQTYFEKEDSIFQSEQEEAYFSPRYSVQLSHSVTSESLQPHGLQHNRPPCPSPTPGVNSNSYPLSR